MLKVFKYPVPIGDAVTIDMPAGAQPLHVAEQHGTVCLWALVDPARPPVPRRFRFAGTGHEITEDLAYLNHVGTFFMRGGDLVFHLFEIMSDVQAMAKRFGHFL